MSPGVARHLAFCSVHGVGLPCCRRRSVKPLWVSELLLSCLLLDVCLQGVKIATHAYRHAHAHAHPPDLPSDHQLDNRSWADACRYGSAECLCAADGAE